MRRAANNGAITVARFLPLYESESEARAVLVALGAADPRSFVVVARNRGADAFLESPFSLRLLHSVVAAEGMWPSSRFELFERPSGRWPASTIPNGRQIPGPSVEAIINVASRLCFYALASGAKAFWRLNAPPPRSRGANEFLVTNALNLEPALADATLDTALFRGESHVFEPSHRTVAEFLAARFLARVVTGVGNSPTFPLRRAIALITGADRRAPSELRGVRQTPRVTLRRLQDELAARGVKVGDDTIWLFLRREGLRFKKTLFALEQGRPDVLRRRRHWRSWQAGLDSCRLAFIDETWIKTNMAPLRG